MRGFDIVGTSGEELVAEYSAKPLATADHQGVPLLSANDATLNTNTDSKQTYYAQNSFKRYMGYEEPDYLMVAGLYASIETSKKSKVYGNFLVKKASYVAEALGWYTQNGQVDIRRAENAIRTACRTTAPNGLRYMYSLSNKNCWLSDKGGSRIYMSGRRYQELQDELAHLRNKYSGIAAQGKVSEAVSSQITSNYQRIKYMLQEVAERYKFPAYDDDSAIKWVADRFYRYLDMGDIEWYCDFITSEQYCDQAIKNQYCPKIRGTMDFFNKYDKIKSYYERHKES